MEFSDSFSPEGYLFYLRSRFGDEFDVPTLFTLDRIERDTVAENNSPYLRVHCFPISKLNILKDILNTITMGRTSIRDKKAALEYLYETDPYGYYTIDEFMKKIS